MAGEFNTAIDYRPVLGGADFDMDGIIMQSQSRIIEVSELAIEKLKQALEIMDYQGTTIDNDSIALWKREWEELRDLIFESQEMLSSVVHPVRPIQ